MHIASRSNSVSLQESEHLGSSPLSVIANPLDVTLLNRSHITVITKPNFNIIKAKPPKEHSRKENATMQDIVMVC